MGIGADAREHRCPHVGPDMTVRRAQHRRRNVERRRQAVARAGAAEVIASTLRVVERGVEAGRPGAETVGRTDADAEHVVPTGERADVAEGIGCIPVDRPPRRGSGKARHDFGRPGDRLREREEQCPRNRKQESLHTKSFRLSISTSVPFTPGDNNTHV